MTCSGTGVLPSWLASSVSRTGCSSLASSGLSCSWSARRLTSSSSSAENGDDRGERSSCIHNICSKQRDTQREEDRKARGRKEGGWSCACGAGSCIVLQGFRGMQCQTAFFVCMQCNLPQGPGLDRDSSRTGAAARHRHADKINELPPCRRAALAVVTQTRPGRSLSSPVRQAQRSANGMHEPMNMSAMSGDRHEATSNLWRESCCSTIQDQAAGKICTQG